MIEPKKVWDDYQKGISYKQSISLYDTVKNCENFFIGKQWEGVDAPDLDKPVFNILKRVVNVFISQVVSDDISASITPFNPSLRFKPESQEGISTGEKTEMDMDIVSNEIDSIIEYSKLKSKNRDALRNAAVDGDACFYINFDIEADTGQAAKGFIDVELIDNTNVIFGNPRVAEVQRQPYIILVLRRTLEATKAEAKANGISQDIIDTIVIDSDSNQMNEESNADFVTVLVKLWKKDGKVMCVKSTFNTIIKKEFDTGYKLYPVAYMSWEKVKNSYHGQGVVNELIPNQIFINKCYAMGMDYVKKMAFPKLIYDKNRLPLGVNNKIDEAIGIDGDPREVIFDAFKTPDMSDKVMELVEKTMQYTKEYMGASDASLGNVRADNTSAIIAIQKATSAPLELVKLTFYQFVEDCVRIFIDIMGANYGLRQVMSEDVVVDFDFSILQTMALNLNVNIGASAYWSETMQIQTADNLFAKQIITDPVQYLESIPDMYVKNKQKIIDDLKQKQEQAAMQPPLPQGVPPIQ